jgi:hypothetical protein
MGKSTQIFQPNDKRWLTDETPIWRYVSLQNLFFYLNGLAFIPSIEKLRTGDPFEGEYFEDIVQFNEAFSSFGKEQRNIENWLHDRLCSDHERSSIARNKRFPDFAAQTFQKHYFDFLRKTRFAWCWFSSWRESAAMWKVYGNQGVAVQSTVGRLRKVLETTGRDFLFGAITYVDYKGGMSAELDLGNSANKELLLRPFLLKRKEYQSESEVRFVTADSEPPAHDGIILTKVNPEAWISKIRLWPTLTRMEEKTLQRAIEPFLPNSDCSRSDLFSSFDREIADFVEKCANESDNTSLEHKRFRGHVIPESLWKL